MTNWLDDDLENTMEVIVGKRPAIHMGKTWLRHGELSQAGIIDLEVLKGTSSLVEIAQKAGTTVLRVKRHLSHLTDDNHQGMAPHKLMIKNDGVVGFDLNVDYHKYKIGDENVNSFESKIWKNSDNELLQKMSLSTNTVTIDSWVIESNELAIKDLDRSAFLHFGTGIPKEIRSHFISGRIERGDKIPVQLHFEGDSFTAYIEMDHQPTPRTRLMWQSDFAKIIQHQFPSHYSEYKATNKRGCSGLLMRLQRLDGFSEYLVSFTSQISTNMLKEDIQAEDIEDKGPKAEGGVREYFGKRYERNPINRRNAILHHGLTCKVCGFNFEAMYGDRGREYIEVHHVKPISTFDQKQEVDPIKDMVTVCSNCHRMMHRRADQVLSVEQLKDIIAEMRSIS